MTKPSLHDDAIDRVLHEGPEPFGGALRLRRGAIEELDVVLSIDNDACQAYASLGFAVDRPSDDPFDVAEVAHWAAIARAGGLLFVCDPSDAPVAFAALGYVDDKPWLAQLSVRTSWMGRGLGRTLLHRAKRWSAITGELWLTTYDALVPWNEPWYAREGFVREEAAACGPALCAIVEAERRSLPRGDRPATMVYRSP